MLVSRLSSSVCLLTNPAPCPLVADTAPLPHHLHHILHKALCIDPADHPLFMSEPAWNTNQARETLAEIAFEGEGVPGLYIAASPVLTA